MTTTSLKLPEELKQRAASAAHELGISPHAFMMGAIRQAVDAVELRAQFVAEATSALAEMQQLGEGHDAADVRSYLRQRLTDPQTSRPAPKSWRE